MRQLAFVLPLLLLAGCPESSTSSSTPPIDPAAQRAAEVELETRMAEGGAALEVEQATPGEPAAAQPLPDLRYYAFDG